MRLLLGLTGSAGLMSMTKYLEAFRSELELDIRIVLTDAADRIVPKDTWLALGSAGVFDDRDWVSAEHVALSIWADVILVAPCTANTLSSIANGRCDNLLTATIICAHVPVLLAANMNALMWSNAAIQRGIETCRADGHQVLDMEPAIAYAFGTRSSSQSFGMARPDTLVRHLRHVSEGLTTEVAVRDKRGDAS